MRTKVLCAAALAAGALTSMAQVYSANIVGYYNVTVPAGKFAMVGNQLIASDNTVATLFSTAPGGTAVLQWGGAAFAPNNNDPDFGWDNPAMEVTLGNAVMMQNNSASDFSVTFVGEVKQTAHTFNFTAGQFQLICLPTPQAGLLQTDFGFPAGAGDQILPWGGNTYAPCTYDPDFGWDQEPSVAVGQGFFVNAASTKSWTRTFTP